MALLHYLDAQMPVRFGIIPVRGPATLSAAAAAAADAIDDEAGPGAAPGGIKDLPAVVKKVAVAFEKISEEYGGFAAARFLSLCAQGRGYDPRTGAPGTELSEAAASKAIFDAVEEAHKLKHKKASAKSPDRAAAARVAASELVAAVAAAEAELSAAGGSVPLTALETAGNAWSKAKGVGASSGSSVLLFNGQIFTAEEAKQYGQGLDWLALALANQETQVIAEAVYYRRLTDDMDVAEFLLRDSGVPTYNARISSPAEPPERLAIAGQRFTSRPGSKALRYLHAAGTDDETKGVTHWAVADAGTAHGRSVVAAALRFLNATREEHRSRVALVFPGGAQPSALSALVHAASGLGSRRKLIVPFLLSVLGDADLADRLAAAPASAVGAALVAEVEKAAEAAGLRAGAITEALAKDSLEKVLADLAAQARSVRGWFFHFTSLALKCQETCRAAYDYTL